MLKSDCKIAIEIHRRIKVSLWAYAYEFEDDPLVSDQKFDEQCMLIDTTIKTGNNLLDEFFENQFDVFSGQWIHKHPELEKLKIKYLKHYKL